MQEPAGPDRPVEYIVIESSQRILAGQDPVCGSEERSERRVHAARLTEDPQLRGAAKIQMWTARVPVENLSTRPHKRRSIQRDPGYPYGTISTNVYPRRAAADSTRSSDAVSATRTCRPPAGP